MKDDYWYALLEYESWWASEDELAWRCDDCGQSLGIGDTKFSHFRTDDKTITILCPACGSSHITGFVASGDGESLLIREQRS